MKAVHLRDKMSYLESVKVHPVRRQNFWDAVAQKCNPFLIRCQRPINSVLKLLTMSEKLCLQWNDFQDNVKSAFGNLSECHDVADVTLMAIGHSQQELNEN